MKTKINSDYTNLTAICARLNLFPYTDRVGRVEPGFYSYKHLNATVDLRACAEDELSILKTVMHQLSEEVDNYYNADIERDLND